MSITLVKGSWHMSQDLWELRWAAMQEAGHKTEDADTIARIQWETSGQLLDEKFLVILAYDGLNPVGYISACHGNVAGLPDSHGLYVVGWYVRPEYRLGAATTRLVLSIARLAQENKVSRVQGIVANEAVGAMLAKHGFREVGTVYEWGGSRGRELRPEAGRQVHRETG